MDLQDYVIKLNVMSMRSTARWVEDNVALRWKMESFSQNS